jgi:H+/Cl- antiporter ClcA
MLGKILVILTVPPEPRTHDIPQQIRNLQKYKEAFLSSQVILALLALLTTALEKTG